MSESPTIARRITIVLALLLTLVISQRGLAQTVRGVVREPNGQPIHAAAVHLLDTDSGILGHVLTDSTGAFSIPGTRPGTYRLRASRIGYTSLTTSPFVVLPGENARIELVLRVAAIQLEPVRTLVEARSRRLDREGFYARRARGYGVYLTPEDIRNLRPIFPEDLLRGIPGIRITSNGKVLGSTYYRRCALSVAVDGQLVQPGGDTTSRSWMDIVHVNDIEAMEVFPSAAGVPVWLFGPVSPCGAIVIWKKGSMR